MNQLKMLVLCLVCVFSLGLCACDAKTSEPIIEEEVTEIEAIQVNPEDYYEVEPVETPAPTPVPEPVITEFKMEESEAYVWECLSKYSPNDVITAGIMGYFSRESEMRSDATAGWSSNLAYTGIDHCVLFREEIDAGLADGSTRDIFIYKARYQYGGFGLGQWSASPYLEELYDFAVERGAQSIGDADMQCEFVVWSIQQNEELWTLLQDVTDPEIAGEYIGRLYDSSPRGAGYMGWKATEFYERYHVE